MTSRRRKTSDQRWNNVVYVNVQIYKVDQPWINVVYINVDLKKVRQRRNNVTIFNVDFHNVGQRRNNVVNMTIWNKNLKIWKKALSQKWNNIFEHQRIRWTQNLLHFILHFKRNM